MENFDGLMGALAVSVFSQGLQKGTEMLLVVRGFLDEPKWIIYKLTLDTGIRRYWKGRCGGNPGDSTMLWVTTSFTNNVHQNHERYTYKTVTVAGGSYTMDEVKKAYKEVMGKNMPSFPAILAWLALKLSAGVQHV